MSTSANGSTLWFQKESVAPIFTRGLCVVDIQEGDEFREANEQRKLENKFSSKGPRPSDIIKLDPDVYTLERDPCSEQEKCLIELFRNGLPDVPADADCDEKLCITWGLAFCTDPICWIEFTGWIERKATNQLVSDGDLTMTLTIQRKSCTECTNDPAMIPSEVQQYYDSLQEQALQQFTAQQIAAANELAKKLETAKTKGTTSGNQSTNKPS